MVIKKYKCSIVSTKKTTKVSSNPIPVPLQVIGFCIKLRTFLPVLFDNTFSFSFLFFIFKTNNRKHLKLFLHLYYIRTLYKERKKNSNKWNLKSNDTNSNLNLNSQCWFVFLVFQPIIVKQGKPLAMPSVCEIFRLLIIEI